MRVKCVDNWMYEHLLKRNGIYKVIRETSDSYIIVVDRVGYVSVSKDKFIIEEDKMENILKVGDKVVCTDDGGMKFLEKDKVYTISELDMEYIYLLEIKSSFSFNSKLFKKFDGDKMEEIRVVRKLEDLHNLENGMGLYIDYNLDVRVKNKNMLICYGNDLTGDRKDNYLEVLKAMGFKFEYKPLRSLEEVIEEMETKRKLHKFNDFNYFVNYVEQDKKYYVSYDCFNNILGAMYFDKETANSYCEELNEIIKTK